MQTDPLRQAKQELTLAWEAVHALSKASTLDQAEIFWRQVLNHLEKVWVKAERSCQPFRAKFEPWQQTYHLQRNSDPLLIYLRQARDADNHSIQEVADVMTLLSGTFGPPVRIRWSEPELVALPVINRGVTYEPPACDVGEGQTTKHPVVLATQGCNFYADYLCAIQGRFFAGTP